MALEQQLPGPVTDLQSRGQDAITWLPARVPPPPSPSPPTHTTEAFPPEATRKRLSYLSALDLIKLQADSLFEGLEKGDFGPVVCLDLFIVVGMLAKPAVRHFSGDWGRLPLVATADDLDTSTLEPVEEGFQRVGGALCRPRPR